jgi:hypothetical protein
VPLPRPRQEVSLPTFTIVPPRVRRWAIASRHPFTTPQKFVSKSRRLSSSLASTKGP